MKCIYCQQQTSLVGSAPVKFHWKCQTCNVQLWQDEQDQLKLITFIVDTGQKIYTLHLHTIDNRTQLTCRRRHKGYIGLDLDILEELINLPYLLQNVNPNTIKDKVNYLLTFL